MKPYKCVKLPKTVLHLAASDRVCRTRDVLPVGKRIGVRLPEKGVVRGPTFRGLRGGGVRRLGRDNGSGIVIL